MDSYDTIIVGGASAGLSAAIYTARQGMKTLVITKDIGGQALLTTDIQNYPGFDMIGGFELANKFKEQAEHYGTEFVYDEVLKISKEGDKFSLKTAGKEYLSMSLILAFGKTPRDLDVEGESRLKGHGISYCAICDGPLFKGKEVAVVGNGSHALEALVYLSSVAGKVYYITNAKKLAGDDELLQTVNSIENKEIYFDSVPASINGSESVESVTFQNNSSGENKTVKLSGVFAEKGYIAKSEFVRNLVDLNENNEVVVDKYCKTSTDGVFACGDVTDTPYKQAVISAGQGAIAALSAYNYVQKKKGKVAAKSDWKLIKN
ncbi:NAD(P)/FAD-dependent oxidoreductase [Ferroplasma acidiphilum]|uniref:FAD-dependent oxidoreductase n=1 Tax=Ferroplasma acidiphilum TaxID=74969 RepID=A0A7K4FMI4_9ARCH|nr:FAD-dependent oxidoreductase [Ferroplasma acidiphilum]NOL59287.1 FAD-dependent oxidoreductase [Ferroplasma acidiphilum]